MLVAAFDAGIGLTQDARCTGHGIIMFLFGAILVGPLFARR
ncbi:hypothetical protein Z949_455 [Sulfitobacter guttiformis KCTC 32187]|nr:hypothetical protein Z949_455 [Sulfitobacter guttiformis KCTC 32187]